MSLGELVSKYIASAEHVFREMKIAENTINLDAEHFRKVVNFAKAYLEDAKYYWDRKKFEVSLASIAYCEGLLDALKLLGAVKFEWPIRRKSAK
jgi:FAD synthetase